MSGLSSGISEAAETLCVREHASTDRAIAGGETVSRYVVLQAIGHGAMGRVLRAYDPKLQREVALKEVRGEVLDPVGAARLVAEARSMAKLSHANVVAVYDVEELESGQVVLVMEFVPGQTLTGWLAAGEHGWQAIVERFVAAGRGLAAAHQSGLLHRDFKPANVLVSDAGMVKVTDFGIAKATSTPSEHPSEHPSVDVEASAESLTRAGTILGTPRYMAPEQHAGETLTAAADQYAFCIALWEALCGAPPFTGNEIALAKAVGPPSWPQPSTPRWVVAAIMRGLSPEVADRWPSMATLLEALQNDPAQRRKRWLTTLAGAGGLAVVGAGYRAWLPDPSEPCRGTMQRLDGVWDDARHEQVRMAMTGIGTSYATPAWERAERGLNDYAEAWASMRTEACEATTIRGEQSPHLLDLRMVCLDRARVELGAVVDVLADADAEVVLRAHKVVDALPPLSGCADIEALGAEVQPPRQADESVVDQARARLARSKSLDEAGRYDAALTAVHGAAALIDGIDYGPIQTEVALRRGITLTHLGQLEDAETALQDTLYRSVRWKQWPEMQSAVAVLMYVVGHQQKRFEEALQYRVLAEGLAHGNPRAEASLHLAASSVLLAQGDYAEAEAEARQGVAKRQEAYGREHPEVAAARTHLASILFRQGNYEDAEAEYRAAIEAKTANLGPTHPVLGTSRNGLSMVLRRQGRLAEAEAELRRALALWESAFGPEHHHVLGARSNLANLLGLQGRHAEAETAHRAVLAARVATVGPDHPDTANTRNNLAHTLQLQGKLDEAEAELRAALEIVLDALGPDHPTVAAFRGNVALFLHDQQRFDEALPLAEASWARRQRDDIPAEDRAATAFLLAQTLTSVEGSKRDPSRARELAQKAVELYAAASGDFSPRGEEVRAWIDAEAVH